MVEVFLVLAGGLVGGLSAGVVAFMSNQSADARLKTQLDHDRQERNLERIAAVRNEAGNHLGVLISSVSESQFQLSLPTDFDERKQISNRLMGLSTRAFVAMMALEETDVAQDITHLTELLKPRLVANEGSTVITEEYFVEIDKCLASIENHRTRLILSGFSN